MSRANYKKQKSFTLIELFVVIAIIGLISSIVLVAARNVREKAKRTAGLQFSAQAYHALGADAGGIWDFDEGTDNTTATGAYDNSGNNNNGTCTNCPTWQCASDETPTGQGCSLEFDGLDDYIEIPDASSLKPKEGITITMWLYLREDPECDINNNYRIILKKGVFMDITLEQSRKFKFTFYIKAFVDGQDYGYRYGTGIPGGTQDPANVLPIQEWTFVAFTYNPLNLKAEIYLNGKIPPNRYYWNGVTPDKPGEMTHSSDFLKINYPSSSVCPSSNGNFPGKIDNVCIYGESLIQAQIQKLYVEGARERGLVVK